MVRRPRLLRRFVAVVRSDPSGVGAGFVALLLSSGGDLLAGLTLGAITGTLESLPGLLVLVPAAIGMRGNIFGGLGSRFSTAIHTGTFRVSRRLDTLVGQNVVASLALSLSISLVLAVLAKAVSVALVVGFRARLPILRTIVRESVPVLAIAGMVDVIAGITIEKRIESFLVYPALLVLVPSFLEDAGALGGILSARIATKLHLGTVDLSRSPWRAVTEDVLLVFVYAVPTFLLLGVSADIVAALFDLTSPGALEMIGVSLLAGVFATTAAVLVGYYGAVATYRLGLDPDNHGIPIGTSRLDFLGP